MRDFYVTTYCNFPHDLKTGKPIGHNCYVLPPKALEQERKGDIAASITILNKSKPLREHRGLREIAR